MVGFFGMFFFMIILDSTHPLWIRILLKGQADRTRIKEMKDYRREIEMLKCEEKEWKKTRQAKQSKLYPNLQERFLSQRANSFGFREQSSERVSEDLRGMQFVARVSELSTEITSKLEMRASFVLLIVIYGYVIILSAIGMILIYVFFI